MWKLRIPRALPVVFLVIAGIAVALVVLVISRFPNDSDDPLILAAQRGQVAKVSALLARGEDPNKRDMFGDTAMMGAAIGGHLSTIIALYEGGGDPGRLSSHGDSILTVLATRPHGGEVDIARWLLDHGADPCVPVSDWTRDNVGLDTSWDIAEQRGLDELALVLREAAADC